MNGAIVISWGAPVRGREAKSLEVFGSALAFYEGLAKQGRIHGHHEYFNLTGRAGGFMMVEGDVGELTKLQTEEESMRLQASAQQIVENFNVAIATGGDDHSVQQTMTRWTEELQNLGYL